MKYLLTQLFLVVIIFCWCGNLNAQQGSWTWVKGSNTPNNNGTYGTQGIPDPANTPRSLYEPAEWTDLDGNFWLFGGMDMLGNSFNSLWKFDPMAEEWTWMNGSSTCCSGGAYGTQGVPDPANHPGARKWAAATWTDLDGNLWMFGGDGHDSFNTDGDLNDLWKYDISTNEWTWMKGSTFTYDLGSFGIKGVPSPSNNPSSRHECAARWVDNDGNLWLFAGSNYTNDVWKYEVATNEWTWMHGENIMLIAPDYGTLGVSSPDNTPGGRCSYNKWTDADGSFYLFGGYNGTAPKSDLWLFNPSTVEWTWVGGSSTSSIYTGVYSDYCVTDTGNIPGGRYENRACWTVDNKLVMAGGFGGNSNDYLNDLVYYNLDTKEWSLMSGSGTPNQAGVYGTQGVADTSNRPPARGGGVGWLSNNCELWYFGGANFNSSWCYNDLWKFVADTSCGGCLQMVTAALLASDTQLCEKFCIDFFDQSLNNPVSWQWIFEGASPATSTDQNPTNICYDDPGVYDVSLIATGSSGVSDTLSLNDYITVFQNPFAPTITQNGNVLSSSPATTYQWLLNGDTIPGATNQSYMMTQSGLYTVLITNETGCKSQSSMQAFLVGIDEIENPVAIVFSNPASSNLIIEFNSPTSGEYQFSIFNVLGQQVLSAETKLFDQNSYSLDISKLSSGIYFLLLKKGQQQSAIKWVKQ